MLPFLLFAAGMTLYQIDKTKHQQDQQATVLADNVLLKIDYALHARISALQILAASPLVDDVSKWDELYQQSLGFYNNFGDHVVITDGAPSPKLLLDTRRPFGTPLPVVQKPKGRLAGPIAMQTGKPAVGDIFRGPIANDLLLGIAVPVLREGKAKYAILTTLSQNFFQKKFNTIKLPSGWSIVLKDALGNTIADLPQNRTGPPYRTYIENSDLSNWTVTVGIARDSYLTSLYHTGIAFGLAILGLTVVGFLGGRWTGRRLGNSITSLVTEPAPGEPLYEIVEVNAARRMLDEEEQKRLIAEKASRENLGNLIESEKRYRMLFENMTSGFVLFEVMQDDQGIPVDLKILAVNAGFEKTTGLKAAEVTGKYLTQVLPGIEKDAADWIGTYGMVALTGQPKHFEQGSELLDVFYSITAFQAGPQQCAVTFQDVTERKRAEAALRQSEARFRGLAEFAPVGIVISDLDDNVVFLNRGFTDLFGYTIDDVPTVQHWWPLAYPNEQLRETVRKIWTEAMEKAARSFLPVEPTEYPVTCRDGSLRHIEFRKGSSGNLNFVIMTDVSRRKEAEKAVRESAEDLRITLLSIGDAVITTDISGRVTRMNKVAEALTGWTFQDAKNQFLDTVFAIVNAKTGKTVTNPVEKVIQTGKIVGLANHTKLIAKNGREYQISDSAAPIRDEDGEMRGVVLVFRDVTESYKIRETIDNERNILQLFVKYSPASIAMMDKEMRYLVVSDRFLVDYGITNKDITGKSHYDIFPEIPERWREIHRRCLAGAVERCLEDPFPRADGRTDWVRWEIRPWRQSDGDIGGIILFSEVITDSIRAREALLEAERRVRFVLESCHIGAWELNLKDRTAYRSLEHAHIFGYSDPTPEWTLNHFLEHILPEYRKETKEIITQGLATKTGWSHECPIRRADEEVRWIWLSGQYVTDISGADRVVGVVQDITDRKQNEERIDHINHVLEAIRRINKLIVYEQSPQTLLKKACDLLIETRGYKTAWAAVYDDDGSMAISVESGIGEDFKKLLAAMQRGDKPSCYNQIKKEANDVVSIPRTEIMCAACPLITRYRGGAALIGGLRHNERQYGILTVSLPVGMADDENELSLFRELIGDLGYALYSLEQKEKRKQAEELYGLLFSTSTDGILIADAETKQLRFANPAICKFLGYTLDEILALDVFAIHPEKNLPEILSGFERQLHGELVLTPDVPCLRKDDFIVYADVNAVPIIIEGKHCLAGFFRDISARKRAEEEHDRLEKQLIQAQKMESVGRLAGGVAHDYNNMLNVIIGYTEMAIEGMSQDQPNYEELTEVLNAGRRSAEITRQLLAFARKQTIDPRPLDLNDTITGMLKMLQRLIGENISLSLNPKPGLWLVKMDPTQIDQILANLCVNAKDAISDIGKITIETDNVILDEYYCVDHAECKAGDYVMLSVSDTGCGMDKETLEKIFEPFYTTKGIGKGTGLGMSTVYGIVKQNIGSINIYSEPGTGTTIKIYIPRHDSEENTLAVKEAGTVIKGNGETLLFVEDEPTVRKMGTRMLDRLGYIVLSASSPHEALNVIKNHGDRIDMLITDVVMPEMNGKELANQIKSIYPEIKVLFMSGYTANAIAHHGVLDEGVNFIQKPFSQKDLTGKVYSVLHDSSIKK